MMRNYRAFYRGRSLDLQAYNIFMAQEAAARLLKVKRAWEIAIVVLDTPLDTATL